MANYSLVVNSKFRPYSFDELVKPYMMYGQAYDEQQNQSGGNRANAVAGMLAADYNAQGKLGDLFKQAEEYNQGLRERVENFNRSTDQFNSSLL